MREEMYCVPGETEGTLFSVSVAGTSYCDGSYRASEDEPPTTCMGYVISGRGSITTRGQSFYAEEGDVYLLHSGDDYSCEADSSEPWAIIRFHVSGSLVDALLGVYGLTQFNHIRSLDVRASFEQFVANVRDNQDNALLFHQLLRQISSHLTPADTGDAARIRAYLDAHTNEQVAVETLAALIGRSPSQTIRIFKKAYGETPYQYALDRRIETAKMLLKNTGMSVKEIAERLCFADEHYFSNIFKQKTGLSPRAFRTEPEKNTGNIPVYML